MRTTLIRLVLAGCCVCLLPVGHGSAASRTLRPGEVLGLVGESGSGKTTIGRAIAGLTKVTGGSLQVLGAEMNGVSAVVVADGLDVSLLGQSFLGRLASVSIVGDEMKLD